MKTFAFFAILILGFTAAITAAVRPEAIIEKYDAAKAPFSRFSSDQQAEEWKTAKEQERARWMLRLKLPVDCASPASALKRVECQNLRDMHALEFEKSWRTNVANGWRP